MAMQHPDDQIGAALQHLRQKGAALLGSSDQPAPSNSMAATEQLMKTPDQPVPGNPVRVKEQLAGQGLTDAGHPPNLYGDGPSAKPPLNVNVQPPADPRRTGPYPMTGGTGPGEAAVRAAAGSHGQIPVADTARNQLPPAPLQGVHPAATGPRPQLPQVPSRSGLGLHETPDALPLIPGAAHLHR